MRPDRSCRLPDRPRDFNPRTPVGCDRPHRFRRDPHVEISIHAPQWGATSTGCVRVRVLMHFNPRTPVGCDLYYDYVDKWFHVFQSTHPSGVRHDTIFSNCHNYGISIHAPQWGATHGQQQYGIIVSNFNPRTPVGCDYHFAHTENSAVSISIHAPQWGATKIHSNAAHTHAFQSTHPSGVRHRSSSTAQFGSIISIHAPQWGATFFRHQFEVKELISIHAPQWGATWCGWHPRPRRCHFNPRTPVGCDETMFSCLFTSHIFQSTHPSGVRLIPCPRGFTPYDISIHAPQWGATFNGLAYATCVL